MEAGLFRNIFLSFFFFIRLQVIISVPLLFQKGETCIHRSRQSGCYFVRCAMKIEFHVLYFAIPHKQPSDGRFSSLQKNVRIIEPVL